MTSETALQGTLGKLALETLVRFLAANGLDGVLDVRDAKGQVGALELAHGQLSGAWWGATAGEPALAAIVGAGPTEFRFRAAATRPPNLSGDISALFGRARARLAAPREAADAATPQGAAPEAGTTMVVVAAGDLRVADALRRGAVAVAAKPPPAQRARTIGSVWKPGDLVALANALIAEYADAGYGGVAWDRDLMARVRRVDAYRPIAPGIPLVAGRIDGVALAQLGHDLNAVVPYLRAVVREVYREADRAAGASAARRGYRNAVTKLWGPSEELWAEAARIAETESELRARLTVTGGLDERAIDLVERDYTIGRGGNSDIALKHQTVSRRHATITPRQGSFVLKDLASTSGTLVNGKPVKDEVALAAGDVIELGQVTLRLEILT